MKYIKQLFQANWKPLFNQNKAELTINENINKNPGVYLIAWIKRELDNVIIPEDVIYVGMTISKRGLRGRLNQFRRAILGYGGHSAGNRFYMDYSNETPYSIRSKKQFYYACLDFDCDVDKLSRTPQNLRAMGKIAKLEYDAIALIKDKTGKEPELNKK